MDKEIYTCHDCGVSEGEIHHLGCDMERCPFCGKQLISCDCCYEKLNLIDKRKYNYDTAYLPIEIYENGLNDEQEKQWIMILENKGRVPYILYPNICVRCGMLWPEMFHVSDEEWNRYIQINARNEMICRPCYDEIKDLIDKNKVTNNG